MTAPRKPVAWAQIEDGEIVAIGFRKCKATGCITPIGPTVDLKPLWALVERFKAKANAAEVCAKYCDDNGHSSDWDWSKAQTYAKASDELRLAMEAMQ